MSQALTRRAILISAIYWVGAPLLAAFTDVPFSQGYFFQFSWVVWLSLVYGLYVIPLTGLLWIGWAVFRLGRWGQSLVPFTVFGALLPLTFHIAVLLPDEIKRLWHEHQLAAARLEEISDQPLLSAHGHAIGVRVTYRVNFPRGLSSLGSDPPADAPAFDLYLPYQKSILMDFQTVDLHRVPGAVEGFPAGAKTFTVDFVPPFLPMSFQQPIGFPAADPRNLCFVWKSALEKQRQLAAEPQAALIEIGPYGRYAPRGSRQTSHSYRLADFYEGAKTEGARECN